jgi:hypothetical protein
MVELKKPSYGSWFFWTAIPVAVICVGYSVLGAYSIDEREHMDVFLASFAAALKVVGISHISPSISGPMPKQFYVNLVSVCVWGVLIHTILTVFWAARGVLPLRPTRSALERVMRDRGLTADRAWFLLKVRTLLTTALFLIFLLPLFLNGIFGWMVFPVEKEWQIASLCMLIFFYLPGALLSPLLIVLVRLPFLRVEYLLKSQPSVGTLS